MFDSYGSVSKVEIKKGWSGDKKYCVTDKDGKHYLLRITSKQKNKPVAEMYHMQKEVEKLGIPMSLPLAYEEDEQNCYQLQSFIEGVDVEAVIASFPEEEQYAYGYDAGQILKKIHTIPAPQGWPQWETFFNAKIDRKIAMYQGCGLKYEKDACLLEYLADNRHLLQGRPSCYQHGDYHVGNMMLGEDRKLYIIDFDRFDFGDPWEEFNRIVWCVEASEAFASGMVDGYFDGEVPMLFWKLLALYMASNALGSLPWAIPYGEAEIETMRNLVRDQLFWYDDMREVVPRWYHKGGVR